MLNIVNIIPASMSGETHQDSEPNIAVNPQNTQDMVATAFLPAPMGGPNAPIFVSTDGGTTWSLRTIVPGNNANVGTGDITVGFATTGGMLYAGILNGTTGRLQILRTPNFASNAVMTSLIDRPNEDQPWVVAGSVIANGISKDRVFVGNNNFNQALGQTATVDVSQNAATAPAPAGFSPVQLEHRPTNPQDGPPVRIALHSDGTVYAAFQRWLGGVPPNQLMDVIVTRDDNWGGGATPFTDLKDPGGVVGQPVATNRFIRFNALMGQERLGADLTIAVDPTASGTVYIAWCDRVGGAAGTDWTIHVSRSTDRGQTWSADLRTITNAKNPSLAIGSNRRVGLLYQQFTGTTWDTKLELTSDGWSIPVAPLVLHTASSANPPSTFLPYLGDYVRMISVGEEFFGVFCGNNTPNMANFPNGVTYQRFADWNRNVLLATDRITTVQPSIDPFFFRWSEAVS
ncbi:hypothetical protein GCM10007874_15650 [Labrys miyagiensis]|uniref:Exo-alpha-sialidase n=1 Tax=Labrys miyagiensis TaxID=346912 RepID=A0ABQ6CFV2_9HYPH|nr:sialidase family protein [Labrys miyagiensis]GLS18548.1 hypothetical protein GCM10007874_15650 [Labrys miyagiensis]